MADMPILRGWKVEGRMPADIFFRAAVQLLPIPVYLCFEGTNIAPDVWKLLIANAVPPELLIPRGTIWPEPRTIHVQASQEFLLELAALAEHHAEIEICDHLHAYSKSRLLIEWHDAFDAPLLIDGSVSEASVREFCRTVGASYEPFIGG